MICRGLKECIPTIVAELKANHMPENITASSRNDFHSPGLEWEVNEVIGEEVIDGELRYLVDWAQTLERKQDVRPDVIQRWKKKKMNGPLKVTSFKPSRKKRPNPWKRS
jgi:hypothetical protein